MSTLSSQPMRHWTFTGLIRRIIGRVIFRNMPWKIKRLIYVASALGVLKQIRDPDEQITRKLSELLAISNDPKGCVLPIWIKGFIWKDALDKPIRICGEDLCITQLTGRKFNATERKAIGEYFFEMSPSWLRYGSKDLMSNEVALLVENFA